MENTRLNIPSMGAGNILARSVFMIYFRTKLVEKFLHEVMQSGKTEEIRRKYEIIAVLKRVRGWVSKPNDLTVPSYVTVEARRLIKT
jgi:hypothetical protein